MIDYITEDLGNGIIRVNLEPERWYFKEDISYPSKTWIIGEGVPKGKQFDKYLANARSWEDAQRILEEAGDRGSKVHSGIKVLLSGETLKWDDIIPPHNEPFTPSEWFYIMSFMNFFEDHPLEVYSLEETIFSEEPRSAGTLDFRGNIILSPKDKLDTIKEDIVIDWKTSSAIYKSHLIQVSDYSHTVDYDFAGIVRLGSRHKRGYEFKILHKKDIEHYHLMFLNAYDFWKENNLKAEPRWKEITSELKLEMK